MRVLVQLYELFVLNESRVRKRAAEAVKQLTVNQVGRGQAKRRSEAGESD